MHDKRGVSAMFHCVSTPDNKVPFLFFIPVYNIKQLHRLNFNLFMMCHLIPGFHGDGSSKEPACSALLNTQFNRHTGFIKIEITILTVYIPVRIQSLDRRNRRRCGLRLDAGGRDGSRSDTLCLKFGCGRAHIGSLPAAGDDHKKDHADYDHFFHVTLLGLFPRL